MIFSDSVTQQFSDPRSIGFKGPYPKFEKLTPRTRDTLFLTPGSAFPFFFAACSHSSTPEFPPALPSSLLCTSARSEFSFLSSGALLGPRPL